MEKRLLVTVAEAAVILGCSRTHIYTRVMRGEIPSLTIGRARRIPVSALEEWIARQVEEEQSDQGQP